MSSIDNTPDAILYPNQPLIEVAFELRFYGEPKVEGLRHEFFENIRADYPDVYVPSLREGVHPSLQHYRFTKEDRNSGVSLALNSIGYFQKEYEGANNFLKEVNRVVDIAQELFDMKRFTRIGWRYINAIPFVRENDLIPLSRIFTNPPNFLSIESHEFGSLSFAATTKFEDVLLSVQLQSDSEEDGEETLFFDIDVYKKLSNDFNHGMVAPTLARLHNMARRFFETSITDSYRDYLKGDVYE